LGFPYDDMQDPVLVTAQKRKMAKREEQKRKQQQEEEAELAAILTVPEARHRPLTTREAQDLVSRLHPDSPRRDDHHGSSPRRSRRRPSSDAGGGRPLSVVASSPNSQRGGAGRGAADVAATPAKAGWVHLRLHQEALRRQAVTKATQEAKSQLEQEIARKMRHW
jgi:hypothetical protein